MPSPGEWLIIVLSAVFTPEPLGRGLTLIGASPGQGAGSVEGDARLEKCRRQLVMHPANVTLLDNPVSFLTVSCPYSDVRRHPRRLGGHGEASTAFVDTAYRKAVISSPGLVINPPLSYGNTDYVRQREAVSQAELADAELTMLDAKLVPVVAEATVSADVFAPNCDAAGCFGLRVGRWLVRHSLPPMLPAGVS